MSDSVIHIMRARALLLTATSKVKAQPVELASTWLCINDTSAEGFIIRTYNLLKRMEHCTAVVASLWSCKDAPLLMYLMHSKTCVNVCQSMLSEYAANSSIVI